MNNTSTKHSNLVIVLNVSNTLTFFVVEREISLKLFNKIMLRKLSVSFFKIRYTLNY